MMHKFSKLNNKELKELAGMVGVTNDNLFKIRRGVSYPSRKLALKLIAKGRKLGYEFSFYDLMTGR